MRTTMVPYCPLPQQCLQLGSRLRGNDLQPDARVQAIILIAISTPKSPRMPVLWISQFFGWD